LSPSLRFGVVAGFLFGAEVNSTPNSPPQFSGNGLFGYRIGSISSAEEINMSELPLEVTCAEVRTRLDSPGELLLVDCREQDEFDLVAIEDAQLLPLSELTEKYQVIDAHRDRPIVVYCHHGMRSLRATNWLRSQGFAQVQSMSGGIDQWAVDVDPTLARY